jgi:hypothetical protein
MVRTFRIGILKYLRDNDVITTVTDIKTPFLSQLDTMEGRKAFKVALDGLSTEKLIVVSGSYDFLSWKLINGVYPIDDKVIEAKLTAKGQSYEQPPERVEKPPVAEEPIEVMPLPPAVKALGTMLRGTRGVTEDRLKAKMKKMGATEEHMDIKRADHGKFIKIKHIPAVPNPLTDGFDLGDLDPLSRISLQNQGSQKQGKKNTALNIILKWVVIIVSLVLVGLIVMILKGQ